MNGRSSIAESYISGGNRTTVSTGMDRPNWVQERRRRYLAQVLTEFEEKIEPLIPHIPASELQPVKDFKGIVRAKLNALATDAIDVFTNTPRGTQINAHAERLKDGLGTSTQRSR